MRRSLKAPKGVAPESKAEAEREGAWKTAEREAEP